MSTHQRQTDSVEKSRPKYLKLYRQDHKDGPAIDPQSLESWRNVTRSFLDLTGWLMRFVPGEKETSETDVPVLSGASGKCLGHLRLDPVDPRGETTEFERIQSLASAAAEMLGELLVTHEALWDREAELATAIPVTPHADEAGQLAARLEAVLRSGVQAVGCHAAAVYLLDDGTSELKLRAAYGLPRTRLAAPPRSLQGALGDLEAMLGHAVVLESPGLVDRWHAPESFSAAVCLPLSTPTNILGTLWVFSKSPRIFSDKDTGVLEVVSGRVAAELEREVALQVALRSEKLQRQYEAAQRLQRGQLPSIAPLLDGWELAGWTRQHDGLGGDFHDWFCLRQGTISLSVGDVETTGLESALTLSALRTALRCHAQYIRHTGKLLERVNLTLWTGSAGDQVASLFSGMLDPESGKFKCSSAGSIAAVLLSDGSVMKVAYPGPALGISPESHYTQHRTIIEPESTLAVCSQGLHGLRDEQGRLLWESQVLPLLRSRTGASAKETAQAVGELLDRQENLAPQADRALFILRRTG